MSPYREPGKVAADVPAFRDIADGDGEAWQRVCKIASEPSLSHLRRELPKGITCTARWSPRSTSVTRDQDEATVRVWLTTASGPLCSGAALAVMTREMLIVTSHDPREVADYICQQLELALRAAFYEAKKGIPA